MDGRIGAIFQGTEQLGGILDWHVDLKVQSTERLNWVARRLHSWTLTAQSYWLFSMPSGKVSIRLYTSGPGYWEGSGKISTPISGDWDTLINSEIEIVGTGALEGRE